LLAFDIDENDDSEFKQQNKNDKKPTSGKDQAAPANKAGLVAE